MSSLVKKSTGSSRVKLSTGFLLLSLALSACADQVPAPQNKNDDQEISDVKRDKDAALIRATDAERAKGDAEQAKITAEQAKNDLETRLAKVLKAVEEMKKSGGTGGSAGSGGAGTTGGTVPTGSSGSTASTGGLPIPDTQAIAEVRAQLEAAHALELELLNVQVQTGAAELEAVRKDAQATLQTLQQEIKAAETRALQAQQQVQEAQQQAKQVTKQVEDEKLQILARAKEANEKMAAAEAQAKVAQTEAAQAETLRAEALSLASQAQEELRNAQVAHQAEADKAKKDLLAVQAQAASAEAHAAEALRKKQKAKGQTQAIRVKAEQELQEAVRAKAEATQLAQAAEAKARTIETNQRQSEELFTKKIAAYMDASKQATESRDKAHAEASRVIGQLRAAEENLRLALVDKKSAETKEAAANEREAKALAAARESVDLLRQARAEEEKARILAAAAVERAELAARSADSARELADLAIKQREEAYQLLNKIRTDLTQQEALLREVEELRARNEKFGRKILKKDQAAQFRKAHHNAQIALLKQNGLDRSIFRFYEAPFPKATEAQKAQEIRKLFTHMILAVERPERKCAELYYQIKHHELNKKSGSEEACEKALVEVCGNVLSAKYFTTSLKRLSKRPILDGQAQPSLNLIELLKAEHSSEKIQAEASRLKEPVTNVQPAAPWGYDYINVKKELKTDRMKVVSSPRYLNHERTERNLEQHSEHLLEAWVEKIRHAKRFVDITTLSVPQAQGKFALKLRAAIQSLDENTKDDQDRTPIPVRLMFGPQSSLLGKEIFNAGDPRVLLDFLSAVLAPNSRLVLSTGSYNASYFVSGPSHFLSASWNHSKIVAVDGEWIFSGGHNIYDGYVNHQKNEPIHDLSLMVRGALAQVGHNFANTLWSYAQRNGGVIHTYDVATKKVTAVWPQQAPESLVAPVRELSPGEEPILYVARLANVGYNKRSLNVCDTSILHIIKSAQKSLYISQQAILPLFTSGHHKGEMNQFNREVFDALQNRIQNGVHIFIITSSDQQDGGDIEVSFDTYTPGPTSLTKLPPPGESRWAAFHHFLTKKFNAKGIKDKEESINLALPIFKYLHVLPAASGLVQVRNHSKVVIADGNMTYVGSHNGYDGSHGEGGYVLSREGSEVVLSEVIAPLWYSSLLHSVGKKLKTACYDNVKVGDLVYVADPQASTPELGIHSVLGRVIDLSGLKVVDRDFLSNYEPITREARDDKRYVPLVHGSTVHMVPSDDLAEFFDLPAVGAAVN